MKRHMMLARLAGALLMYGPVKDRLIAATLQAGPVAMEDDDDEPVRRATRRHSAMVPGAEPIPGTRQAYKLGGVGVVPIYGPMFAGRDDLTEYIAWYYGGTVTEHVMDDVAEAAKDPGIRALVLDVNSPGGDAFGLDAAGEAVRDASNRLPTWSQNSGLMCSAAYWVGSAAPKIAAAKGSLTGSIGTILSWYDYSTLMDRIGIKEVVFRSKQSPYKWADHNTTDGAAVYQREVDSLGQTFVDTVASHRGRSSQRVLDDFGGGEVLVATDALKVGMVDQIASFGATCRGLSGDGGASSSGVFASGKAVPVGRLPRAAAW
jgi:capsid assembly protease